MLYVVISTKELRESKETRECLDFEVKRETRENEENPDPMVHPERSELRVNGVNLEILASQDQRETLDCQESQED
jgi:hypothetical protein